MGKQQQMQKVGSHWESTLFDHCRLQMAMILQAAAATLRLLEENGVITGPGVEAGFVEIGG